MPKKKKLNGGNYSSSGKNNYTAMMLPIAIVNALLVSFFAIPTSPVTLAASGVVVKVGATGVGTAAAGAAGTAAAGAAGTAAAGAAGTAMAPLLGIGIVLSLFIHNQYISSENNYYGLEYQSDSEKGEPDGPGGPGGPGESGGPEGDGSPGNDDSNLLNKILELLKKILKLLKDILNLFNNIINNINDIISYFLSWFTSIKTFISKVSSGFLWLSSWFSYILNLSWFIYIVIFIIGISFTNINGSINFIKTIGIFNTIIISLIFYYNYYLSKNIIEKEHHIRYILYIYLSIISSYIFLNSIFHQENNILIRFNNISNLIIDSICKLILILIFIDFIKKSYYKNLDKNTIITIFITNLLFLLSIYILYRYIIEHGNKKYNILIFIIIYVVLQYSLMYNINDTNSFDILTNIKDKFHNIKDKFYKSG